MSLMSAKKMLLAGGGIDTDAKGLIQRMTIAPTRSRQKLISDTIKALKNAGIWARLDGLYFCAAHTEQAALLNWVGPVVDLVNTSMIFTADRSLATNGTTRRYAQAASGMPSANRKHTASDAAIFSLFSHGNLPQGQPISLANASPYSDIYMGGNQKSVTVNGGSAPAFTSTDNVPVQVIGVRSGTTVATGINGGTLAAASGGTGSLTAVRPRIGAEVSGNSPNSSISVHACGFGLSLTQAQSASLNTILRNYLAAVGAL